MLISYFNEKSNDQHAPILFIIHTLGNVYTYEDLSKLSRKGPNICG